MLWPELTWGGFACGCDLDELLFAGQWLGHTSYGTKGHRKFFGKKRKIESPKAQSVIGS